MANSAPLFQHSFQKSTQYLQIQADDVACAIELRRVDKIVSLMALDSVPSSPTYLAGVFNYHGLVVPVIDLSLRIGQPHPQPYNVNSSVILCETMEQGTLIGLIATTVADIIEVNYADLQLAPEFSGKQSPFYACFRHNSTLCFLLNSDVLLDGSVSDINAVTPSEIRKAVEQKYNEQ